MLCATQLPLPTRPNPVDGNFTNGHIYGAFPVLLGRIRTKQVGRYPVH